MRNRLSGVSFSQSTDEPQLVRVSGRENYGFIESLEISNFKSYHGSTLIAFSSFTCIIGPNGSGKSNLMDAISFVLGVKTQQLRGKKLTDLIHRNESTAADSPISKAFVELIYISTSEEESESESEERMIFRRTITKSGSTMNEYNGQKLDFKQYSQRLSAIGVLVRARNFLVFQGDVTNIAQKSGKQLTKWFEQISGSDAFKHDYDCARKEQQTVQNEFEGLNERNRNLAREKKQMKHQKDEAHHYRKMEAELAQLRSEYFRFQLFHILTDVRAARADIGRVAREVSAANASLRLLEDGIKLKQAQLSKTLRKKTNLSKSLKKKTTALNKKRLKNDKLSKEVSRLAKEETKQNSLLDSLSQNVRDFKSTLMELKEKEQSVLDLQSEYLSQLEQNQHFELEQSQYEAYQKIKAEVFAKTAHMRAKRSSLDDAYQREKDRFDALHNELDMFAAKEGKAQTSLREAERELTSLRGTEREMAARQEREESGLRERRESERDRTASKETTNSRLSVLLSELSEMEIGMRDSHKEMTDREILQTLQKLFSGVYGRLCDLVECRQKRFETAVSVGLGVNHNAIIVENKDVAIQCMQHMRKTRRGHFRFLPLDDIKTLAVSQELRRFGGTAQPMMDVINYEPQFERAVQFALSNTIVVDSINEARDISYTSHTSNNNNNRVRTVSLDGSVIQPNGNISGGFHFAKANITHRFNAKERKKKLRERDGLIEQLRTLDDIAPLDIDELQNSLTRVQNALKSTQFAAQVLQKQSQRRQRELKSLKAEMKRKRSEMSKTESKAKRAQQKLDDLDSDMNATENEIFVKFGGAQLLNVSNIREYEQSKVGKIEEQTQRKKELSAQLSEISNKYQFSVGRNEICKSEMRKVAQRLKRIRKEMGASEQSMEELESDERCLESAQEESDQIQKETRQKRKVVSDSKKEIDSQRRAVTEKMKEIANLKGWLSKLSQTQRNILSQAKHEMVALSSAQSIKKHRRKRRRKNDGSSSDQGSGSGSGSDDSVERRLSGIDLSEFDSDSHDSEGNNGNYESQKKEYLLQIEELRNNILELQPNMKALAQYKKIASKWKTGHSKHKEMRKRVHAINNKVDGVREKRCTAFTDCFEVISHNIGPIYSQLTSNKQYKNGGKAFLNSGGAIHPFDDEIVFAAMPPGKPFRDIQQLSGGEKSVASLALLFAIHSYKQSPFFILDEIDAALDQKNVQRVCNFIKQKSVKESTQIIVISLKDQFFSKANSLIGVCKDRTFGDCSKILSIDLTQYDNKNAH